VNLIAQAPLRPNAEAVTDQQHPDHQVRIDRRLADAAVEGSKVPPDLFKVDKSIDRSQQVVGGDMSFERELIEQRSLFDLPMPHHDLQSWPTRQTESLISLRRNCCLFQHNRSEADLGRSLSHIRGQPAALPALHVRSSSESGRCRLRQPSRLEVNSEVVGAACP
jgi:hypothetical protein